MENVVIIAIIAVIVGLAVRYIYKAKKSGQTCVGCPDGKQCGGKCSCCCSDDTDSKQQ